MTDAGLAEARAQAEGFGGEDEVLARDPPGGGGEALAGRLGRGDPDPPEPAPDQPFDAMPFGDARYQSPVQARDGGPHGFVGRGRRRPAAAGGDELEFGRRAHAAS